jgi:hypothetical protein
MQSCETITSYKNFSLFFVLYFLIGIKAEVLSLNHVSFIYLPFQLNILRVGPYLLKGSLNSHVRGSVKVLIKGLNYFFLLV